MASCTDQLFDQDLTAWAAARFSPASSVAQVRTNGLRAGVPSRVANMEVLARTQLSIVVADDTTVVKLYELRPSNTEGIESLHRELVLGSTLCRHPLPGVVGVTTFWTLPNTIPAAMQQSPLPNVVRDWTTLLRPADAERVRREQIIREYNAELEASPGMRTPEAMHLLLLMDLVRAGKTNIAYADYAQRNVSTIMVATEQPRISGVTLDVVLGAGDWPTIRRALELITINLAKLQTSDLFQHGDLSPSNIMIDNTGTVRFLDLSRSWSRAVRSRISLATRRYSAVLDMRFLGVWLARYCFTSPVPDKLRELAAALVAPSRVMVDEALEGYIRYTPELYVFHDPQHSSFREYVVALADLAELLLTTTAWGPAPAMLASELLYDVAPWTVAAAVSNRMAVVQGGDDIARPQKSQLLDVFA